MLIFCAWNSVSIRLRISVDSGLERRIREGRPRASSIGFFFPTSQTTSASFRWLQRLLLFFIAHQSFYQLSSSATFRAWYNTGIWDSYSQYIHSATGIASFDDAYSILGMRNLTRDSVWLMQNQWTWSGQESEGSRHQATREEFTRWLHRVLLFALLPPIRDPFARSGEQCTTNVATFLRVCTFCVDYLQYPSHWVGAVIDDIVNACSNAKATLTTRAEIPTSSPNSYGGKNSLHKANLEPFRVEILTQITIWSGRFSQSVIPTVWLPCQKESPCNKCKLALATDDDDEWLPYLMIGSDRFDFKIGGLLNTMVLGFVLSTSENPDGEFSELSNFTMKGLMQPLSELMGGKIRSDALTKGSAALQIFSCVTFHCDLEEQKHSIEFYMDEGSFAKHADNFIFIIRTDS